MTGLFYLQDSRTHCGNDVMWWKIDGRGYTSDLREAATYTKDQADAMARTRDTNVAWPKDYIDKKSRPVVDFQYIDHAEAMAELTPNVMVSGC